MSRKSRNIPTHPLIRIFCEGLSEKQYFEMLIEKYNRKNVKAERVNITVLGGLKGMALLRKAQATLQMKGKNKIDAVYVIFDRDDLRTEQLQACDKYAKEHGIRIMFSSICFEIWILMHYQKINHVFSAKELNQVLSGESFFNLDYAKFKGKPYDDFLFDRVNTAKKNGDELLKAKAGKWYQYDSYTNISECLNEIFAVDTF